MTARTKTSLKALFEDGDTTSGTTFADLIDSFLNLVDTSAQSVTSPVTFTTIGATTVSATTIQTTTLALDTVSASSAYITMGNITNVASTTVSASSVYASSMSLGGTEIVSFAMPYGGYSFTSAAATVIGSAKQEYKAGGGTTITNVSTEFTMPADNRLLYSDSVARHFHIVAQATVTLAAGTNQDLGIYVYHYEASAAAGTVLAASEARTTVASTNKEQITTHADVMMKNGDYLELWLSNDTGTNNVTVSPGYVFAVGMLT